MNGDSSQKAKRDDDEGNILVIRGSIKISGKIGYLNLSAFENKTMGYRTPTSPTSTDLPRGRYVHRVVRPTKLYDGDMHPHI